MAEVDPIGVLLKSKRKARGISVPKLADILSIPKERIYKWEQGEASPKYPDRMVVEKWINEGVVENVPHGAIVEESPAHYITRRQAIKNGNASAVPVYGGFTTLGNIVVYDDEGMKGVVLAQLPADGEVCHKCQQVIVGKKIIPFVQVGGATEVNYFPPICEPCYTALNEASKPPDS